MRRYWYFLCALGALCLLAASSETDPPVSPEPENGLSYLIHITGLYPELPSLEGELRIPACGVLGDENDLPSGKLQL